METKKCTICKEDLPKTEEFFASRKDRKAPTFQSSCRKCHKEYRKKHYEDNKEKYIKKAKAYDKKVNDWFQEIRKEFKCSNCNEDRWWVLDFHHLDPKNKEGNVAQLVNGGSKKKAILEMQKCIILCSNCHRDLHHKERQAV